MRVILDSHVNICCGPESTLLLPYWPVPKKLADRFGFPESRIETLLSVCRSQAEFIDELFGEYARMRDKPRWAEKTPRNVLYLDYLFLHFPDARFLHMIRDPRDTVCSLRTHPRHKLVDGRLVEINTWHPLEDCITEWVASVSAGLNFRDDPRYTEMRYESLVSEPRTALVRLFDFLEERFDESLLAFHLDQSESRDFRHFPQNPEATRPIYTNAVGRWRRDLTPEEIVLVERKAGALMAALGYENHDAR
jgi:hypothetical protein